MAPPKGATTPYFAFVNANRAAAKAALVEAGSPAGMGDVGKELGARWRALSDEEKKVRAPRAMRGAQAACVRGSGSVCGPLVSACACADVHERADGPRGVASRQVYVDQVAAAKEAVRFAAQSAERSFRSPRFWRQRSPRAPRRPDAHATRAAAAGEGGRRRGGRRRSVRALARRARHMRPVVARAPQQLTACSRRAGARRRRRMPGPSRCRWRA